MSVIVFIFLSLLATCTSGLVLDLIPRNIIYPPTYPPNSTLHQRIDLALSRLRTQKTSCSEKRGELPLSSDGSVYYVNFTIGSKKVAVVASLDTGSHFLWIDCKVPHPVPPPKVTKKRMPNYDPNDSASYKPSTCPSSYCKKVPPGDACDAKNQCKYEVCFADRSYSKGFMGFENISFKSPAAGSQYQQITNVLFGCGTDTNNTNENEDGVFGIGGNELSVLKQTGNKLSYCLGDINHPAPDSSHLALGKDVKFSGNSVKFELKNDAYVLQLKKIVFGKNAITMSQVSVQVDTGSALTYLSRDIYKVVRSKVEGIIGKNRTMLHNDPKSLCYALDPLMTDFPSVILSFRTLWWLPRAAKIVIDIKGMFVE